jgi:hypothetical protein
MCGGLWVADHGGFPYSMPLLYIVCKGHGCMWLLVLAASLLLHWKIVMLFCVRVSSCNL